MTVDIATRTTFADATTFADRFRRLRRNRIDVGGRQVHSVFALEINGAAQARIERVCSTTERPQGLRIAAAVGLEVQGTCFTDLVLRSTTAPDVVNVIVHTDEPTVIYLWNSWTVDDIDHAWLGNAGMLVETDLTGAEPTLRLSCSDGIGAATFDDLVVCIAVRDLDMAPSNKAEAQAAVAH